MRAVVLSIGRSWYAIPIERVVQVVEAPVITPLPTTPRGIRGLINLRGEVVPVLASSELLEGTSEPVGSHLVVARCARGLVGASSRCLPVVVELGEAQTPSDSATCLGLFSVDDRLITLIDLDALSSRQPVAVGIGPGDLL